MFEIPEPGSIEEIAASERPHLAANEIRSAPAKPARPLRAAVAASVATAILVAAAFEFFFRQTAAPAPPTPALDHFWSSFRNGAGALMVVSDTNLVVVTDILGGMVPLNEYRNSGYPRRQLDTIRDPAVRSAAENLLGLQNTGFQDATTVSGISLLLSRYRVPAGAISARDFRMPQPENLILLGHPKANPWARFFEEPLNFRYEFDFEKRRTGIVIAPRRQANRRSTPRLSGTRAIAWWPACPNRREAAAYC